MSFYAEIRGMNTKLNPRKSVILVGALFITATASIMRARNKWLLGVTTVYLKSIYVRARSKNINSIVFSNYLLLLIVMHAHESP